MMIEMGKMNSLEKKILNYCDNHSNDPDSQYFKSYEEVYIGPGRCLYEFAITITLYQT
jgi:hypothetical protein